MKHILHFLRIFFLLNSVFKYCSGGRSYGNSNLYRNYHYSNNRGQIGIGHNRYHTYGSRSSEEYGSDVNYNGQSHFRWHKFPAYQLLWYGSNYHHYKPPVGFARPSFPHNPSYKMPPQPPSYNSPYYQPNDYYNYYVTPPKVPPKTSITTTIATNAPPTHTTNADRTTTQTPTTLITTPTSSAGPSSTTAQNSIRTTPAGSLNNGLSTDEQNIVLSNHNSLRSQLAQGVTPNQTGTMPTGSNIAKFAYNFSLQTTAQNWANNCSRMHSNETQRNGAGENIFWTSDMKANKSSCLSNAVASWWGELVNNGTDASLVLTLDALNRGIGHWSQCAWATTTQLGCGVSTCANEQYVVCHYFPAGNSLNETIYLKGQPCSACNNGTLCAEGNDDKGLCVF